MHMIRKNMLAWKLNLQLFRAFLWGNVF